MFYQPSDGHSLPHDPLAALVAPRPIGWISTVDASGRPNVAPYSFFNLVAYKPPQLMFSSGGRKDSVNNIEATGEFVVNLATYELRDAVVATSVDAPAGESEFDYARLTAEPSELVKAPRVGESPVHMECKLTKMMELPTVEGAPATVVTFGEIIGVHIADWAIEDGIVQIAKLQPLSRLGYKDYAFVTETFEMGRPLWGREG